MISDATRAEVMKADEGECQFFCGGRPATQVAHFDHQGAGGLPPDHWKNQLPNLAASCGECHPERIHVEHEWVRFRRPSYPSDVGEMMIRNRASGLVVPNESLWFYMRHRRDDAREAAAALQTIGVIDEAVAERMVDLRNGAHLLESGAEFGQYVSSLGWDPNRAEAVADAWLWAQDFGGWPEGVPHSKVALLMDVEWPDDEQEGPDGPLTPENYLGMAEQGASYTELRKSLETAGLKICQQRIYLVGPVDRGTVDERWRLYRTRDELRLLQLAAGRSLGVMRVNAIKGGLKLRRGKNCRVLGPTGVWEFANWDELLQLGGRSD